ncbi:MAG TPA: agmatinase [Candidatus Deferrimicrobiaceae bacterium]
MKPYAVTFGGIPDKYSTWEDASFAIIPFPVDLTASYVSGSRNGPRAILDASQHMELFDEETKLAPYREGIFTAADVARDAEGAEATLGEVEKRVSATVKAGKFPILLGGEHTGTIGAVNALRKRHEDLTVIYFDAHADLRDEYLGSKLNHACVARRIVEAGVNLIQVGIRSMSEEEDRFLRKTEEVKIFYAGEVRDNLAEVTKGIVGNLKGNVYISIDLDVFDPGIMPAVGTPEPGGLTWYDAIDILRDVMQSGCTVVGCDIMELAPIAGIVAPEYMAARLAYRLMGWILAEREEK